MGTLLPRADPRRWRVTLIVWCVAAALGPAGLSGCSAGASSDPSGARLEGLDQVAAAPAGPSWEPAPTTVAGLRTTARAVGAGYALATAHGPVHFLAGVNLGGTTPGFQPGELSIDAAHYRIWFAAMRHLGIRVVRIYTIHPPAFYRELNRYNTEHRDGPLYLMQGVYPPDAGPAERGDLYDPASTDRFSQELRDAVAAVYGMLDRPARPGHAGGSWRSDVSRWLAGWIVGAELDPAGLLNSDRRNASRPDVAGRYFTAGPQATPTERWLAARMEELATAQATRGDSTPVAFVNWPTTDPLRHPDEPLPAEDLVGIDANHIRATTAWPGGQFASYHAYPYYPDSSATSPTSPGSAITAGPTRTPGTSTRCGHTTPSSGSRSW